MKLKLALIISLFQFIANSQNYKITYSFSMNIDADTIKNIDRRNYFKNYFPEHAKNTFGILWVNKDKAIFEQEGDLLNSSYRNKYIDNYYISLTDKKVYKKNHQLFSDKFEYFYFSFTDYQWQLTKENKVINGYTCFKALGSLQALNPKLPRFYFEAWFCPEIPISYGPEYFSGLPGLIFEIYFIDGKDLHWKLKSIEKIDKKDFKFPDVSNSEPYLDSYKRMFDFFQSLKK
jgi:GLPGLI family protein